MEKANRKKYLLCTVFFVAFVLGILYVRYVREEDRYFPKDMERVEVEIVRFDSALLGIDTADIHQEVKRLYDAYPVFMPMFAEDIIGVGDSTQLCVRLPLFLSDTTYGFEKTNRREQEVFADISDVESELNDAFTKIKYLYPSWRVPKVYLFVSGFNGSIVFVDRSWEEMANGVDEVGNFDIAVGADLYLGSDWEYYNKVVYNYQKTTMKKECVAADVVSAYLFRCLPYTSNKNRLLENMIYRGKIMYLVSLLFPNQSEGDVMGYTEEQMKWAKTNERAIWRTIMDKKDLFKTDSKVLTSYLNEGPFTAEISQDAPPRLGTWIGWKIAEAYMEANPDVSLQMLMEEGDAQKILEYSQYKP